MKKPILALLISIITISFSSSQTVVIFAGSGTAGYSGDGSSAIGSELDFPRHLEFDSMGNLYFADENNSVIRMIDTNGIITTIAGNGSAGYSGDGGLATSAQINNPRGICIDNTGNIYISDENNVIRKIDVNGIITTIAGNGTSGFSGDGGLATSAQLQNPKGITIDNQGNLYIADISNERIRKVDTNNIITTYAGYDGFTQPGGIANLTNIQPPYDVCIHNDELYFIEFGGGNIRKVDNQGIISTLANGFDFGTGSSLAFDNNDNIYTTGFNGFIYKLDNSGNVSLILENQLASGLVFDTSFNLYFSATFDNQIKIIDSNELSIDNLSITNDIKIFPNPTKENINIEIDKRFEIEKIDLYNVNGALISTNNVDDFISFDNKNLIKIKINSIGVYFVKIQSKQEGIITKKIIKI